MGGTVGGLIGFIDGGSIGHTLGPQIGLRSIALLQIGWFFPLMHVQ